MGITTGPRVKLVPPATRPVHLGTVDNVHRKLYPNPWRVQERRAPTDGLRTASLPTTSLFKSASRTSDARATACLRNTASVAQHTSSTYKQ